MAEKGRAPALAANRKGRSQGEESERWTDLRRQYAQARLIRCFSAPVELEPAGEVQEGPGVAELYDMAAGE